MAILASQCDLVTLVLSSACFMQGLIYTVACDKGLMRLYDCRNYQIGPFQTFLVGQSPGLETALPGSRIARQNLL